MSVLFLGLVQLRRRIAQQADCADYREYRWRELKRFDYAPADIFELHAAIEAEVVPLARRLSDQRRTQLGITSLRPWNGRVDSAGRAPLRPFTNTNELAPSMIRLMGHVAADSGAFMHRMHPRFLDLVSRPGKSHMGYQNFFPRTGLPYVFMNAVGSHQDVLVLLHEMGHAYHASLANTSQALIWNVSDIPMEFNEVASQAMELLGTAYFARSNGGMYSPADAERALKEHLLIALRRLRGTVVDDVFQHWIYTEAPAELSAADLQHRYARIHERFFPDEDWDGLEQERGMLWHTRPHITVAPFYMIEYTMAQLGALQVWRNALRDRRQSMEQFRSSLALGGTRSLRELYAAAEINLAFDQATVSDLTALLAERL